MKQNGGFRYFWWRLWVVEGCKMEGGGPWRRSFLDRATVFLALLLYNAETTPPASVILCSAAVLFETRDGEHVLSVWTRFDTEGLFECPKI